MATGGHIGFTVFLDVSEAVAPRVKRIKIWACRVKVNTDM